MKTISTALLNLFATGQMNYCGVYNFKLIGGSNLYYSGGDVSIIDPATGITYTCGGGTGPYFDRKDNKAKMHQAVGLQVDTLVFDVIPGQATINGAGFLTAVREGVFDGAQLIYSGAYFPKANTYSNPTTATGLVTKYTGNVAEVDCSRNLATFTINSYLELLNQNMPINLFTSTCVNSLYDASCTLNAGNFTTAGTALTNSTVNTVYANLSQATGYFSLGTINFTSGVNSGISRTIKLYTNSSPSSVSLISPLPSAPSAGDTFTIFPGCDKTQSTCINKFGNSANFRGFPFIPQAETAG